METRSGCRDIKNELHAQRDRTHGIREWDGQRAESEGSGRCACVRGDCVRRLLAREHRWRVVVAGHLAGLSVGRVTLEGIPTYSAVRVFSLGEEV